MFHIADKGLYYLVYGALVAITFVIDNVLLKKTDKTSRVVGYVLSIIVDLSILGYGIYLYLTKGEDQTGFVLGGILAEYVCYASWDAIGRTRNRTKGVATNETRGANRIRAVAVAMDAGTDGNIFCYRRIL